RQLTGQVTLVPIKEGAPAQSMTGSFADVAATSAKITTMDPRGRLDVWDATTGKPIGSASGTMQQGVVAMSGDNATIALAGDTSVGTHTLRVVDGKSLQTVRSMQGKTDGITALAVSPSGDRIATGSSLGSFVRWSLASGELESASTPEEHDRTRSVSFDD